MRFSLFRWLLHPSQRLPHRVAHALTWGFAGKISVRALNLSRTIILARLLAPNDFGIMAVTMTIWQFLDVLTRASVSAALIQKKDDIQRHLDTVWTLNFARSLLLTGLLLATAPYIASIFNARDATLIIRVMAFAFLIGSLTNPGIIYFQRDLEFHKIFKLETSSAITGVVVSITLAVVLRNVWALVFGFLAGALVYLALSYVAHPFRPRFRFVTRDAKELFSFGIWVYVGNVFDIVSDQIDKIVVTRVMGLVSLGIFHMATRVSLIVSSQLSNSIYNVAFPAYARIQDKEHIVKSAYLHTIGLVASVMAPLAVFAFFAADVFVAQVLGEKWIAAVPAIKILAVAGGLMSIKDSLRAVLFGLGRPALGFWMNGAGNLTLIASVYPLTQAYGVSGAAMALLLATAATVPIQLWFLYSVLKIELARVVGAFVPAVAITSATALVLAAGDFVLRPLGGADLVLMTVLASMVFAGTVVVLWRFFSAGPLHSALALRGYDTSDSQTHAEASIS